MTIAYNHLNLPKTFTFANGAQSNTIEVLYDAAGTKLRKTVKTGSTTNYTQDYLSGIEYRDGAREAIYTAEGRVKYTSPTTTRYEYSIKDHLENARLSFTDKNANGVVDETNVAATNEVIQENQYYPFGLNTEGPWMNDAALDNRYQYNGKELNDDFGLNLNDYGARWYDAAVGRWWNIDPLAEPQATHSPYHYTYNNPLKFVDSTGMYGELPDAAQYQKDESQREMEQKREEARNRSKSLDGQAPPTIFINEEGKIVAETEDGSDDVYIIDSEKQDKFVANLRHNIDLGKDNDKEANDGLGLKYRSSKSFDAPLGDFTLLGNCALCREESKLDKTPQDKKWWEWLSYKPGGSTEDAAQKIGVLANHRFHNGGAYWIFSPTKIEASKEAGGPIHLGSTTIYPLNAKKR